MDLLKAQLDRLQKQLNGLTATQKMLTAALVAIMVMTLLWWGKYASDPELEPVLDQAFSQEDISRITADLAARGIHYSVSADRVMVAADKKIEVLAALSFAHLLPRDTKVGFEEMVQKMNPFQSDTVTEQFINRGKEITLSRIIQNFPNVSQAEVMIDPKREQRVENSIEPSATVTISMNSGFSANAQLVDAAADVVQGAQAGLSKSHIKVVVGGIPRHVHDTDTEDLSGQGNEQLELAQRAELLREQKIRDYLGYISGLKVFVTAKVNSTSTQEQRRDFDPKNVVSKESQITSETNETSTPGGPTANEPGVVPNAGLAIPQASSGSAAATTNEEKSSSSIQNFVPERNTSSRTPAGDVTVVAATVRVPAAYFAMLFTRRNPDIKDPSEQQLKPLIDAELPKIKTDVLKCTGLTSEKDVAVDTYWDATPMTAVAPQLAASTMTTLIGGYGKEAVLAALALLSLFMVSMMVRKGTPALAVVPAAAAAPASSFIPSGELVAGEVGEGGGHLDGMELNSQDVRSAQMLEQVSTMVKESPDVAATLVKRWLNRS